MTFPRMNSHALEVLEFRDAIAVVADLASSSVGAEAVRSLLPSNDPAWVQVEMARVAEGIALLVRGEWIMPAVPDLLESLRMLHLEGYVWNGMTLRGAATMIASARSVRRALIPLGERAPLLAAEAERLCELPGVAEEIIRTVGEEGEIRDNASPELSRVRRGIQGARARIVARLTEFAASMPPQYQVSDASISVREGRYVIPLRREGRGEIGGIVHGESQTGATLFVEPPIAIEMMNRLRELEATEAREVHRILREQTDRLRPHAGLLEDALSVLTRLDCVYARSRYAHRVDGHPPVILPAGTRQLMVSQGRHPLLLGKGEGVVPFDLRMEEAERTLVISGPNTGGKTVLLKALGLIALLVQSGVVPPIGPGSSLPIFEEIFADIGDEQSIEASLSTFSAHLKNLRKALEEADHRSLVLIDEIGSGTDPQEGGALAEAILLDLTARSTFTVATTHLGTLKLLAAEDSGIVNASLQFDAERLEPTFRLVKGVPGRSYGLAIARRLGLPEAVLDMAEAALPQGERDIGKLLRELEEKEQRLDRQNADLAAVLARSEALTQELSRRERELGRREVDAELRARQEARDLLLRSRAEVEAAIREVRVAAEGVRLEDAARSARQRVEGAARIQEEQIAAREGTRARDGSSGSGLTPGMPVRIESLGRTGILLELRDNRALVDAGGVRLHLATEDLTVLPPGQRAGGRPASRSGGGGRFEADLDASPEVDLRGLRADELELRLARALDTASMAGLPTFRVIHGKGSGVLRSMVHDLLERDPRISDFRPGDRFEGGTGVTVAKFA